MDQNTHEYITSERFIHDNIVRQAEEGVLAIPVNWRRYGVVAPFIISWPAKHMNADNGQIIKGPVLMELPQDRASWTQMTLMLIQRTSPYALLICDQFNDQVVAIVESRHGTKSWRYPIETHGLERVLGEPTVQIDVDCIGILWRRNQSASA